MEPGPGAFDFQLSPGELHWLAGAFGSSRLYLPDDPLRHAGPLQHEAAVRQGLVSLQRRGLISAGAGATWQVDGLPALLVQWLAAAEHVLQIQRLAPEGNALHAGALTSGEQGLLVRTGSDSIDFSIFRSPQLLTGSLFDWLGVPAASGKTSDAFGLRQPLAFLPAAWKDPDLGDTILSSWGLERKTARKLLAWAGNLKWVSAIQEYQLQEEKQKLLRQIVLCSDGQALWASEALEETCRFDPVSSKDLAAKLRSLL